MSEANLVSPVGGAGGVPPPRGNGLTIVRQQFRTVDVSLYVAVDVIAPMIVAALVNRNEAVIVIDTMGPITVHG